MFTKLWGPEIVPFYYPYCWTIKWSCWVRSFEDQGLDAVTILMTQSLILSVIKLCFDGGNASPWCCSLLDETESQKEERITHWYSSWLWDWKDLDRVAIIWSSRYRLGFISATTFFKVFPSCSLSLPPTSQSTSQSRSQSHLPIQILSKLKMSRLAICFHLLRQWGKYNEGRRGSWLEANLDKSSFVTLLSIVCYSICTQHSVHWRWMANTFE